MEFGLICLWDCGLYWDFVDSLRIYFLILFIGLPIALNLMRYQTGDGVFEAGQYVLYELHRSCGGTVQWKEGSAYYSPQPGMSITLESSWLTLKYGGAFEFERKLPRVLKKNGLYTAIRKAGFRCSCWHNHLYFEKNLKVGEVLPSNFVKWVEIMTGFAATCKNFIDIQPESLESNYHCAFCKEAIHSRREIVFCSVCRTPQHPECFRLNQRCSVFGCSSAKWLEERLSFFDRLRAS